MNVARVESLTQHLRSNPEDASAMEDLAALYMTNGAYDAAIGPLARALELDPHRRSLWVALDVAVIKSGRKMVTDAELSRRAAAFKSALTS
ncbi:MAG TPA: hypothetical protein VIV83_14605 [Gemmatimonadales bacterium]